MTEVDDFDGCHRLCRTKERHSLVMGSCVRAPQAEPSVSMSKIYTATDGYPSIGYDNYTVQELADLIEPALRRVAVRLGPNALAMLQRGETVGLVRWRVRHPGPGGGVRHRAPPREGGRMSSEPYPPDEDFSVEVFGGDMWVPVSFNRKTIEEARELRDGVRKRVGPDGLTRIIKWRETSEIVETDEKET